jgi:hypothetical protein
MTTISAMAGRTLTFKELIEAAALPHRELWKGDGQLNLTALAEHYKKKGHPISGASFSRIFDGTQQPKEKTIDATHFVFRIPRSILRGEPVSAEMEKTLTDFKFSTLLLAQKIETLPKDDYYVIMQQIERALDNAEKLREAMKSGNVASIDRRRG